MARTLTYDELLHTERGRAWLRTWCEITPLRGDADRWRRELKAIERKEADEDAKQGIPSRVNVTKARWRPRIRPHQAHGWP